MEEAGLREMLLGRPLNWNPENRCTCSELDAALEGVIGLVKEVYGDTSARKQATVEMRRLLNFPQCRDGHVCRRAALLFALSQEPEIADHYAAQGDGGYAADLRDRVLPFIIPRYMRYSGQSPDAFVVIAAVLSEMWRGERLGNWPLETEGAGSSGAPQCVLPEAEP